MDDGLEGRVNLSGTRQDANCDVRKEGDFLLSLICAVHWHGRKMLVEQVVEVSKDAIGGLKHDCISTLHCKF